MLIRGNYSRIFMTPFDALREFLGNGQEMHAPDSLDTETKVSCPAKSCQELKIGRWRVLRGRATFHFSRFAKLVSDLIGGFRGPLDIVVCKFRQPLRTQGLSASTCPGLG